MSGQDERAHATPQRLCEQYQQQRASKVLTAASSVLDVFITSRLSYWLWCCGLGPVRPSYAYLPSLDLYPQTCHHLICCIPLLPSTPHLREFPPFFFQILFAASAFISNDWNKLLTFLSCTFLLSLSHMHAELHTHMHMDTELGSDQILCKHRKLASCPPPPLPIMFICQVHFFGYFFLWHPAYNILLTSKMAVLLSWICSLIILSPFHVISSFNYCMVCTLSACELAK